MPVIFLNMYHDSQLTRATFLAIFGNFRGVCRYYILGKRRPFLLNGGAAVLKLHIVGSVYSEPHLPAGGLSLRGIMSKCAAQWNP